MTATLFSIAADIEALESLLYELGGDVTDEQAAAAIDQWLADNQAALRSKLDSYGALIEEKEALAESRKKSAKRLVSLARTDEALADKLRERLLYFFRSQGINRLETERFKFSLANNGGAAPVVLRVQPEALPAAFQRTTVTADLEAIRKALQDGQKVEGAELGERGQSLRIK